MDDVSASSSSPRYSILLTDFNDPTSDYLLPAGNLREPRSGARRADVIVVTKCPDAFTIKQRDAILAKLIPTSSEGLLFRGVFELSDRVSVFFEFGRWRDYEVVLVTGIAKAKPFVDYVKSRFKRFIIWSFRIIIIFQLLIFSELMMVLIGFRLCIKSFLQQKRIICV